MLALVRLVVIALVAAFGTASGALALGPETALRASSTFGSIRVGNLGAEGLGTRQENLSVATILASECCHGVEATADAIGQAGSATGAPVAAEQDATQVDKPTKESDVTRRPSGFRRPTVQESWDNAEDGSEPGTKACPDCGKDVTVAPGQGRRDWDIDHQPEVEGPRSYGYDSQGRPQRVQQGRGTSMHLLQPSR